MWYTINAEHDADGIDTGKFYVAAGPDLEGGCWRADLRSFSSVEAAMADYGMVAWQEPDNDASPDVVKVGCDE